MAASDPSIVQMIAPALLQLNRGDRTASIPFESCPSPPCGSKITQFPDCPDCANSSNIGDIKCDSCWTACASPCDDDECHMPQPCYDEDCPLEGCGEVDSCVDSACAADSCTDVTCPETVHCNATCFDTTCLYNFGDEAAMTAYDQACQQGQCFGFLPVAPGLDPFGGSDMMYQCPQSIAGHTMPNWAEFSMPDHGYHQQHDHVDNNRHKRRRTNPTSDYTAFDQPHDPWSGNQLDAMFSAQTMNMTFDQSMQSSFVDYNCDPSCHHQLKHNDVWADEMASSLPCQPVESPNKLKRRSDKPARLLPAPSTDLHSAPLSHIHSTLCSPSNNDIDHVCHWAGGSEICGHHFTCAKDLDDHVQSAHTSKLGPQAFVCLWEDCNTTFKHRGKLNRHISGAHSKYHAYICNHTDPGTGEACARTFCTKEQLKNHETTHTGERKYKCQFCDHTSATKTQHNTHERIHTKEKPYQCPWCGHKSGDSSNLSKHVRNKHPGLAGRAKKSMSVETPGGLLGG